MIKSVVKGIDILFLARPVVLVPVWGFSIFGFWCSFQSKGLPFDITRLWTQELIAPFAIMVVFSLSVAAVYVLNQIADFKVDAENEGFPLLVKGDISTQGAVLYAVVLVILSIVFPILIGYFTVAFLSFAALGIGILYSFKPTCFSGRPVFDFLTNAAGYGWIAFGAGWLLSPLQNGSFTSFLLSSFPYVLLMCGGSISSTLPDFTGDKKCGKRTTAVVLGIDRAHLLATGFILLGGITALLNGDYIALTCAVAAFILDVLYGVLKGRLLMEAAYKVSGAFCMLVAGIVYPLFIPAGIFVFCITWLYFRVRHKVSYPSLIPVSHASKN